VAENNVLVDTPDEIEHTLIEPEFNLALALKSTSDVLFEKKEYVTPDKQSLYYRLLKPANYDPKVKYPLVLFFHGGGERGKDANRTGHFRAAFCPAGRPPGLPLLRGHSQPARRGQMEQLPPGRPPYLAGGRIAQPGGTTEGSVQR
jgi:hypothetical protein